MGSVIGIAFYCGEATVVSNYQSTAPHAFAYETAGLDDKENGYQEQSQSSWGKQKWRPDEEDRDGDTSQPRSNKDASDDCSKSSSEEPMSNSSATRSYDHSWSDNSCCKEPTFSSNGGSSSNGIGSSWCDDRSTNMDYGGKGVSEKELSHKKVTSLIL